MLTYKGPHLAHAAHLLAGPDHSYSRHVKEAGPVACPRFQSRPIGCQGMKQAQITKPRDRYG